MNGTVRPLREADLDRWARIRAASFGSQDRTPEAQHERLRRFLTWSYGAEEGGALQAVATWYPFRAWIGGVSLATGALAGVATAPEARRRGHVRSLLLDGLSRLHEREVGFALEHPFDPRFYAAFGFRTVPAGVSLDLPLDRLAGDAKRVAFTAATAEDAPVLAEVHTAFARRRSFTLARDLRDPGEPAGTGLQWRRVYQPEDGFDPAVGYRTDGGYAVVSAGRRDGRAVLDVKDVAWTDAAARRRVLDLLGAWRGQSERALIDLPADDPLARDEAAAHGVARPTLQVRVVDVPAALRPLRTPVAAPARTVRIHDATCPWNAGTWRIAPGPEGTEVTRATGAPEAELGVGALASLLAGTAPATLLTLGEAEGDGEALRDLARTTADQPPFLGSSDYF